MIGRMTLDEPTSLRLAATSRAGLSDHVYDALVELLINGDLEPGQPIRIDVVAKQLDVSATPVREALVRMEATGLIRRETHKGFRVASAPTRDELGSIIEARMALEPVAARLACERADAELIAALAKTVNRQRSVVECVDRDGFRSFMSADQDFHQLIARGTRNRYLALATDSIGGHVQRWRAFSGGVPVDRAEALAEHEAILAAFEDRDPQAAGAAMAAHLLNLQQRVQLQLDHGTLD